MKYISFIVLLAFLSFGACKSDKKLKSDDSKTVTKLDPQKVDSVKNPNELKDSSSTKDKTLKNIPTPPKADVTPKKMWYIVGGSFKEFKNAEKLYNKLTETGYDDSEIMDPANKFNRVVISSFTDETKARAELSRLRAARGDNSIWLLEGK